MTVIDIDKYKSDPQTLAMTPQVSKNISFVQNELLMNSTNTIDRMEKQKSNSSRNFNQSFMISCKEKSALTPVAEDKAADSNKSQSNSDAKELVATG